MNISGRDCSKQNEISGNWCSKKKINTCFLTATWLHQGQPWKFPEKKKLKENSLPSNLKWRIFKFEKYQRAILGPSTPAFVATLEKKLRGHFPGFAWFFLKSQPKK